MATADGDNDTEIQLPTITTISSRHSTSVQLMDSSPDDSLQLLPAAVLVSSSSPSHQPMSTKANAFSIDSLIKSRDFLSDYVPNRENGVDTFIGSCSPTDVEFTDDDVGDDEPCSIDEEDDIDGKHQMSPADQQMLQARGYIEYIDSVNFAILLIVRLLNSTIKLLCRIYTPIF